MKAREKAPTQGTRERAIDRLEKDVEELRHLAGSPDGDAELERIRAQVAELLRKTATGENCVIVACHDRELLELEGARRWHLAGGKIAPGS